jgi:hypothetical protein
MSSKRVKKERDTLVRALAELETLKRYHGNEI